MIDSDLAQLFQVETKVLNQAAQRNINRLPDEFRFQLNLAEHSDLKSQFVTSKGGVRKLPWVYTEQDYQLKSRNYEWIIGSNPKLKDSKQKNVTLQYGISTIH